MPTLGLIGVALGLIAAVAGVVTIGVGLASGRPSLFGHARTFTLWVLAGAVLATFGMERALLTHDFSIAFVAANNSRETPLLYSITGMWSALQGSILLWSLILAGYLAAMTHWFRKRASDPARGLGQPDRALRGRLLLRSHGRACEPVRRRCRPRPRRRRRAEPALAGQSAHRLPPRLLVPRLRRVHRAVLLRRRHARHRAPERGVAARDPPLDIVRLGVPDDRHRDGSVVVLPGPRLGRLLGVGPGRERRPLAVALRNGVPALGHGPRAAGPASGLEPLTSDLGVLAHDPRDLPDPFRRARLGALVLELARSARCCWDSSVSSSRSASG